MNARAGLNVGSAGLFGGIVGACIGMAATGHDFVRISFLVGLLIGNVIVAIGIAFLAAASQHTEATQQEGSGEVRP